jgi:hypothetical protein
MPNKIEIAPSGRASCRGCKKTIAKGELRFGEEFANPYSEDGGKSFRYWHLPCAATKLANELAPVLAAYEGRVDDRASIEGLIAEHLRPEMPYLEHAPNARARCRACDESIAKGDLRVAFERTFDGPMGPQKGAAYCHVRCLPPYLEREKERSGESIEAPDLARLILAHTPSGMTAEELARVPAALGLEPS